MKTRVTVALVMPVRNEEKSVDETLRSVFASTRLPDEIVVADGLSTDGTVEMIKGYTGRGIRIRVVPNPSIYCGGGRNVAIRSTSCDVVVIADFGNPVSPRYLEEMVRPFEERDGVDMVMGILLPHPRTDFEHCMGAIHYYDNIMLERYTLEQKMELVPKVLLPGGGCIAMTRRIFEAVGGYPEWLSRSQDKLFSRKAHSLGAKVVIAWDAYSYNHLRSNAREVYRMSFTWSRGCGQSRYIRKHFFKAAGFYGTLAALAASSAVAWPGGAAALLLLAAYVYKAGVRRIIRLDGGLKSASYIRHATAILVSGDLGEMAGHIAGWWDWFFDPKYRRRYREYTRDCDKTLLTVIER